ncbi:MAG: glycosyltransferase family 2 protein [Prolixibacteraceae bacterium]|nr:glycosyltransferase family 2 protein [Prolixibacteraceae bacterium]
MNHRKVAVVILNWNGSQLLDKYLPSVILHSNDNDVEVIVADNFSTDDSVEKLRSKYPKASVIELKENYGFSRGYNEALKQVKADYFVILNSDVEVTKNWIDPVIKRMEEDEKIAAVQPKILSHTKKEYFEYAGAAGGFIDKYGYPFCRGRILNVVEKDEGQYNEATPIFWATGACMFIRAKLFTGNGGFDPDFWAHMEEIDLCWRLKNQGYSIWYEPESIVYHLGGATLEYNNPKKIYLNFRNNLLMLIKNLPAGKFIFILLFRMILDGVAAVKFLIGFQCKAFFSVIKAHGYLYRNFGKFYRKRRELLSGITETEHKEIFRRGIMLRFFIQKRRKFSQLKFKSMQ